MSIVERHQNITEAFEPLSASERLFEHDTETLKTALAVLRLGNHDDLHLPEFLDSPIGQRLSDKVAHTERLIFLLPAFPAKSSNRNKTESAEPDLGEYLGLSAINEMCATISRVYSPGAEVMICSDGRVFNDLVMVSDEDLKLYSRRIREIIEAEGMTHLRTYSLDDCHDILDAKQIREDLVEKYGPTIDDIRQQAKEDPSVRLMLNGIHRFMKDDLCFHFPELSKNQMMLRTKKLTYQVVQRSRSWDALLKTRFPDDLRLSIHPYPITHRKYGIKLVSSSDKWATPWHNVTIKRDGAYCLVGRDEALAMGARVKYFKDIYAYYEV